MSEDPTPWRLDASPGKGMGMFARWDLKAGDDIFQESPLIEAPDLSPIEICRLVCDLNQHERAEYRSLTRSAPDHILAEYLAELQEDNFDDATGEPIVPGLPGEKAAEDVAIFWNNCFTCRHHAPGIFVRSARLNHSCVPNCYVSWNEALGQGKLCTRAIRDIGAGEELLICYDEDELLLESLETRTGLLKENYGFDCDCEACYVPTTPWAIVPSKRDAIAAVMEQIYAGGRGDTLEVLYNEVIDSMEHIGLNTWKMGQLHIRNAEILSAEESHRQAERALLQAKSLATVCLGVDHPITKDVERRLE